MNPYLQRWDETEPVSRDAGELRWRRWLLGGRPSDGRSGLSRWIIEPGARSTPPHSHVDDEEFMYVLAGSGLSWQNGKTYEISAGDVVFHPCWGAAHTVIAGDRGIELLAFGEGSRTHLTEMPRTGMWWVGPHWIPAGDVHPFDADAVLGPLDVPAPEGTRPESIVKVRSLPASRTQRGRDGLPYQQRHIGQAVGSSNSGMRHLIIDPGAAGYPHHCHSAEEEILVVLGGSGELRLGEDRMPVQTGHVLLRPPSTGIAHSFTAGDDGLELLCWGTRVASDQCFYPDTNKVSLRGLGVVLEVNPVSYWE